MSALAREVFGEHYNTVAHYVDLLTTTGVEWGLLGPREVSRVWERHILNSVAMADLIPSGASVVDVGSGAGLPGIPLAILRADLHVTLLEPLLRRSKFLTQAVDELGITSRVLVVRQRAEDHRARYDAVVSRALAPLDRLVEWCAPLRAPSGVILAFKGSSASAEVATSTQALVARRLTAEVLQVRAHSQSEATTVVRLSGS